MTDKERRRELSDDELVAALVICNNRKGERCSSCPAFSKFGYPRACKRTVDLKVAELYKRIKRENTALREKAERAEKERDAAIADMKTMALVMRESDELQEGCCFACKYDSQNLPDNVMLAYGECPGYDSDDCFEWRGAGMLSSRKEKTNER